jgi:acid phosphatase (class A)
MRGVVLTGLMTALALAPMSVSAAQDRGRDAASDPPGYLDPRRLTGLAAAVPAPPVTGSDRAEADRTASDRLRALEDTDRWLLATRHAELRPGVALAHFDCALGFRIEAAEAPRLAAILTRVLQDANDAAERAKARGHRPRPVGDDPERRSCQVVTPAQRATASHPSGSASVGAAYGRVLAELVPDRADAVSAIGRQIAISRMVCGMHYPSDVEDGAALGAAVAEAIIVTSTFAEDAAVARGEIEAARTAARTSPACAAERAALAITLP